MLLAVGGPVDWESNVLNSEETVDLVSLIMLLLEEDEVDPKELELPPPPPPPRRDENMEETDREGIPFDCVLCMDFGVDRGVLLPP
jgi:hypothetical protein